MGIEAGASCGSRYGVDARLAGGLIESTCIVASGPRFGGRAPAPLSRSKPTRGTGGGGGFPITGGVDAAIGFEASHAAAASSRRRRARGLSIAAHTTTTPSRTFPEAIVRSVRPPGWK